MRKFHSTLKGLVILTLGAFSAPAAYGECTALSGAALAVYTDMDSSEATTGITIKIETEILDLDPQVENVIIGCMLRKVGEVERAPAAATSIKSFLSHEGVGVAKCTNEDLSALSTRIPIYREWREEGGSPFDLAKYDRYQCALWLVRGADEVVPNTTPETPVWARPKDGHYIVSNRTGPLPQ